VDAIHRAGIHTGRVLYADARLGNHVRHFGIFRAEAGPEFRNKNCLQKYNTSGKRAGRPPGFAVEAAREDLVAVVAVSYPSHLELAVAPRGHRGKSFWYAVEESDGSVGGPEMRHACTQMPKPRPAGAIDRPDVHHCLDEDIAHKSPPGSLQ
jgi:hypothetical protein